jgi:hypothetical protein
MRRLILAIGAVSGSAAIAAAQDKAWKEYVYPEDNFAISAPAQPRVEKQTIRVVGGTSLAHIYSVSAGEHGAFMVFVYRRHRSDRRSEKEVEEQARAGALRSVSGKLTAQSEAALGIYRGSQIDLESQHPEVSRKNHRIRNRFYVVGRRLYQLMAISPAGEALPAETDRWFKSFRLVRGTSRH